MIVLARVVNDVEFMEMTGKYWDTPVFKNIVVAEALVYSSDDSEVLKAEKFAEVEGYQVFILEDTPDVLAIARKRVMGALK